MPEKPKKKVAGLSTTPAARRAAARAQAARQQRGADVFGGDVDEIVDRSFVGQAAQAASEAETQPGPIASVAAPMETSAVVVPAQPAASTDGMPVPSLGAADAVNPWLMPHIPSVAAEAQPEQGRGEEAAASVPVGSRRPEAVEVGPPTPGGDTQLPGVTVQVDPGQAMAQASAVVASEAPVAPPTSAGTAADEALEIAAVASGAVADEGVPLVDAGPVSGVLDSDTHEALAMAPAAVPTSDSEVPAPVPDPVATPASRPRRGARRPAAGAARQAVLTSWTESTMDLKLGKNQWRTMPFRFAPDLVASLNARVAQDRETSGRPLTVAQYVDAAMRIYLPADTEAQLALAEAFFIRREGDVPAGRQASHRVSPAVYEVAYRLPNDLRMVGRARTAVHVYSASLDLFLTAISEEGPLT
ncbi:hypothetical protein ACWEQL_34750 [Kitasatospora sp. NPDC004240]